MEDYYGVMAANGDRGKRVWATEFGWPTTDGMGVSASPGYEFANDINEQQQADYLVRAYTWSRNWGHAGVMFLWNLFDDQRETTDFSNPNGFPFVN